MPTHTHTAPPRPTTDRVFAAREQVLSELYATVDAHGSAGARAQLDEILAGSKVTSKSGRSVELVLHEDGPVLETLSVLRRLDGLYMTVLWGLIDGGTRADHTVRGEHDGLLRLAHELIDRLDGFVSDQRAGTCRVCGRMDVAVTQVPGHPGDVCVDEVACFVEFRRREGWPALAQLVDRPDGAS